jgi:hypothetical protein
MARRYLGRGRVSGLGTRQLLAEVEEGGIVWLGRPEQVPPLLSTLRDEQAVARSGRAGFDILVLPALAVGCAEPDEPVREWLETIVMECHLPSCGESR